MVNKNIIKIPDNTTVLYCKKKSILTVTGPLERKSLKLRVKINVYNTKNFIEVTSIPLSQISNNCNKKFFAMQGTTLALIKQLLLETSFVCYTKLKLVGVGYRAFDVADLKNRLLLFKLGYCHPIYLKTRGKSNIFCLKTTRLFISSNSYQNVTQTAALIRSFKKPEPYKGKGILHIDEKIILKEGKKI